MLKLKNNNFPNTITQENLSCRYSQYFLNIILYPIEIILINLNETCVKYTLGNQNKNPQRY